MKIMEIDPTSESEITIAFEKLLFLALAPGSFVAVGVGQNRLLQDSIGQCTPMAP